LLLHAFFALLYFYNVSSYSAIQPQVCNKLSVQCSVFSVAFTGTTALETVGIKDLSLFHFVIVANCLDTPRP